MKKLSAALAALIFCAALTACDHTQAPATSVPALASAAPATSSPAPAGTSSPAPTYEVVTSTPIVVPEREVMLVAKVLRGECYDDQTADKREVARVICNRVSDGRFGASIEAIITAPRQFAGYAPGNIPTANDTAVAREVLTAWYAGGCRPLSKYLYFSSGGGRCNVFK